MYAAALIRGGASSLRDFTSQKTCLPLRKESDMSLYQPKSSRLSIGRVSKRPSRRARNGVVLLLVVTLLVMFLLIGVTGVIVATSFLNSSKAASGSTRREVRNEDFSDRVVMQLLRGADRRSAIWGHDLLGDLYGVDSYLGTIQTAVADPLLTATRPNDNSILLLTVTVTNRFDWNTPNDQRFFEGACSRFLRPMVH
jgi:hypothetical protein